MSDRLGWKLWGVVIVFPFLLLGGTVVVPLMLGEWLTDPVARSVLPPAVGALLGVTVVALTIVLGRRWTR